MVRITKVLFTQANKNCGFYAFLVFLLTLLNTSCSENNDNPQARTSKNESTYFYPIADSARIYCYRNITDGLEEEFHRIYTIKDSIKHLIVERFSSNKRFLEAINYNVESKKVVEHIVVNRNNEREIAEIKSSQLFPYDPSRENSFVSEFSAMDDSTLFRKENHRNFLKVETSSYDGVGKRKTFIFKDFVSQHLINLYTNKGRKIEAKGFIHFAEGLGPVEWYDENKKVHFKLEKILSQKEWIRLMQF